MGSLVKKPKLRKPEATAQEKALSRRQDDALSREVEEENRRKKALFRATLGDKSLLSGLTSPGGPTGAGGSTFTGVQFAPASKAPASLLSAPKTGRPNIPSPGRGDFS